MIFSSSSDYFKSLKERSLSTPTQAQIHKINSKTNLNNSQSTNNAYTSVNVDVNGQQTNLQLQQQRSYSHNDAQSPALQQRVLIEKQGGLSNHLVLYILFIWYLFSALTLFTNKYIVTYAKGNPTIIGKIFNCQCLYA
jgi:hypothetical protein